MYGEGAQVVSAEEEEKRLLPVIESIRKEFPDVLISVDTYKPSVADKALSAGAHIINDISGLRLYPEMADVAKKHSAPIVVMHSLVSRARCLITSPMQGLM